VNKNAVKFFSFLGRLTNNVYALNLTHVQLIKDTANAPFINVREYTRNTQARHVARQGSEVNVGSHFQSL
jgi:hypothetical protein